ncbi:MAG: hypothetical protein ACW96U_00085 [Candidatus Heimdallarchaeaceae archaeon]|jgi:hypothetical protein
MTHKEVLVEQRAATKDILVVIEGMVEKYDIVPEDYHIMRSKIKSKIFRLSNVWHMFFATVVDAKFLKRVNEDGEKEETHLKDGEDSIQ